ncbi:hypothetical protein [Natranaeroarchaeum aerophilus]|uniref:AGC-kinase C-terminal domain-containing protein n=1 Tax=Natranaeroarchaeum aerophilus TaxID=2917711 RepID=A0AAE3K4J0_9EURY|nr:hypothetical protein [Natranaeroarchaeum aerophilus]MCL9812665.1 hypothetical protein [Natranaeroarchaeum aerophilus]
MCTTPTDRRSILAVPVAFLAGCIGGEDDDESSAGARTDSHDGYVSVPDQTGDGRSVRVTAMSASTGYYLELRYDGRSTTTDAFAANEIAGDLELELDPPLESDTAITALLRTTDDDETVIRHQFEYEVEVPQGTLVVHEQQGTGEQFIIDEMSADAPYTLVVDYGSGRVETDEFEADRTVDNLVLDLDPPIREDRDAEIRLQTADGEWELAEETVRYTFERTASLRVADQSGDGDSLDITEASANVEYELVAAYDGTSVETDTFAAETLVAPELDLDPRIVEETTVEVTVRAAEDGTPLQREEVLFTPDSPEGPALTEDEAIRIAEDTFPLIGTPSVFERWLDDPVEVEAHPDGYRVRLGYLAARQRAVFSSAADRTEAATAEFAIDVFEALFTGEYHVLDVEIESWLTSGTNDMEQAGTTRLHRDAVSGVDWDDLRDDPTETLPSVAESYEFEYFD